MQDTRTPVVIGVTSLVLHMLLSWLFARWIGHAGIALGVSIGVLIEALVMGIVLVRRGGMSVKREHLRSSLVSLVSALVMGFVLMTLVLITWRGGDVTPTSVGLLVGYLAAGLSSYVVVAALLGSAELAELRVHVVLGVKGKLRHL